MNITRFKVITSAFLLLTVAFSCNAASQKTNTFNYSKSTDDVSIEVVVEYPSDSDAASAAIREELFGIICKWKEYDGENVSYDGSFSSFSNCANKLCDRIFTTYLKTNESGESTLRVSKGEETANYVVYGVSGDEYCPGAAHGMYVDYRLMFRNSDGKYISQVVNRSLERSMQPILKDAFTREEIDLDDLCIEDGYIPLPGTEPTFSTSGVVLIYQPYEIAPYAYGTLTVTVPYDKIMPYLTAEAKSLL